MQPDDQRTEFQTPQQTGYYSPQAEVAPEIDIPAEETAVDAAPQPELPDVDVIQWQAPEYIQVKKQTGWFLLFGAAVLVLIAVAIFIIKSLTFAILIPVMAVALVAYIYRAAGLVDYTLSGKGIYINDVLHPFTEFRAFGVIQEGEMPSIVFIPVRRFRPGLTVYFPREIGERVVDLLGVRIPMQQIKPDAFDKIVRSLGL